VRDDDVLARAHAATVSQSQTTGSMTQGQVGLISHLSDVSTQAKARGRRDRSAQPKKE